MRINRQSPPMHAGQFIKLSASLAAALILSACAAGNGKQADLKAIYDKSAQYHLPDRNPIIVIPGILGSSLVDENTGESIWGSYRPDFANPKSARGAQLISLPIDTTIPLQTQVESQTEDIQPSGVLEDLKISLLGFPVSIQVYAGILNTLGAGGYVDQTLAENSIDYGTDHYTCFQFDYDWRKDVAYNASEFKKFIEERRAYVQGKYEEDFGLVNAEVKFDIAAHSTGALLTRYYLRYGDAPLPEDGSLPALTWAGANDIERAVLVAPPNAGSLDAFDQLINGSNTGRPLLPYYSPAILGSFPAIYQLMTRARHNTVVWDGDTQKPIENLFDAEIWQKYGWGLSGTDKDTARDLEHILPNIESAEQRAKIAREFQAHALKRAEAFHAALDVPAKPPEGVDLFLVAGDVTPTVKTISVDSQSGKITVLEEGVGDKTVLRTSALMDERESGDWQPTVKTPIDWKSVLFVPSQHRNITSDPVFEDNVLYWLLEEPR